LNNIKKHINKIIISIISLIITIPLLKPWYIFWLDQILNVYYNPKIWANIFIISKIKYFLKSIDIDILIFEKIIIINTFILPIIWMYLLFKKQDKNKIYALIWLLFIIINPFFLYRFIDWQINIYFSYSLYPLFFYFSKQFFEKINIKNWLILAFSTLFLALTSLHNVFFIFIILTIFWIIYFFKYKNLKYIKSLILLATITILINCTWFIPLTNNQSNKNFDLVNQVKKLNKKSIETFQVLPKWKNIYTENIFLKWYWWIYNHKNEKNIEFIFYILFIIIILGLYYRTKKWLTYFEKSLITLTIISYILSLWISQNNIFSFISNYLYNNIDFYKWLREPNKWLIFVAIFYSYFSIFWLKYIFKLNKKYFHKILSSIIIITIVIFQILYIYNYTYNLNKNITIKQYPNEWKEIRDYIFEKEWNNKKLDCEYKWTKSDFCYNILILPRHEYMQINWIWKIVWMWITNYFWYNILYWDNIEKWTIYTESNRKESKIIEKYIWKKWIFNDTEFLHFFNKNINKNNECINKFIYSLKSMWIKYILYIKWSKNKKYNIILKKLIESWSIYIDKENSKIILYEIY